MKDLSYTLMLIKANKFHGAKDLLEELHKSDPQDKDILYISACAIRSLIFFRRLKGI